MNARLGWHRRLAGGPGQRPVPPGKGL